MNEPIGDGLQFDHLVLIASDVEATLRFYREVVEAEVRDFDLWRNGETEYPVLHFGTWKINVHALGSALHPIARNASPGTLDICFGFKGSANDALARLRSHGIAVELGPVRQYGARGPGTSLYFRDPDGNLLELICYGSDGGTAA